MIFETKISFYSVVKQRCFVKDKNNNNSYIQYNHKRKRKESQELDQIKQKTKNQIVSFAICMNSFVA